MAILTVEDRNFLSGGGGGSAASALAGVGGLILNSHKTLALCLVGLSVIFLLVTVASQIKRKTPMTRLSMALMVTAFLIFCGFSFLDLRKSKTTVTTTESLRQQQGPNTADTKGNYSPAISGTGNAVNYGGVPPASATGKEKQK